MTICATPGCGRALYARGVCRNCYIRAWRNGKLRTRPRHSDPLTLPTVRLLGTGKLIGVDGERLGRDCRILRSAFERGHFGLDTYSQVLDAELGHIGIHRLRFYRTNGWLPEGRDVTIRHRCDRPGCFEDTHLFVGTQRGNVVADSKTSLPAINAAKRECVNGHPFDDANTYWTPDGHRGCRECRRRATREWQRRNP